MCGLAGYGYFGLGSTAGARPLLQAMAENLRRRGPDGTTVRQDGPVGLAFTRLSIVDPEGGDQPLLSPDGTVALIANGEVYNHHELAATLPRGSAFRTRSDCEVLVHLYQRDGLRFLDRVRGIYAVVIWDRARNKLVFARDRFGIKPLYFHHNDERVVFASEIKALFADPACPRRLNWQACLADQTMTSAPTVEHSEPTTFFDEISSVPAGVVLELDMSSGEIRRHRYWALPSFLGDGDVSRSELVGAYRDALRTSVEESCMSDAEIGLFLSGGVDSAAVAAFAQVPGRLHTFTALNGGTLCNGDGEFSHRVATALGLPNHQVAFGVDRVPGVQEWRDLLWLVESPLCGAEQFYKYELHRYARSVRPDLKVMLLGQASDEFNGGYTTMFSEDGDWDDFVDQLGQMARRRAFHDVPHLEPWWAGGYPLLTDDALAAGAAELLADPYQAYVRWKYRDIQQYNCWHEDRTAAGNGVEARVPFLDHRIVEVAASVPAALRADLLWDKRILREALEGVLAPELIRRPKVSFYYGAGERHVTRTFVRMLCQDGEALVEQALSGPDAGRFINADGVRATLRRLRDEPAREPVNFVLRVINLGLLEQLVATAPHPFAPPSAIDLQPALPIRDWDAERAALDARILQLPPVDVDAVPALAGEAMLVQAVPADGTHYVVVDGSIEYVVEDVTDRDWLAVLRGMDGERTLRDLLDTAGASVEAIEQPLREAVDVGVVRLTAPPAPEPVERATPVEQAARVDAAGAPVSIGR